MEWVWLIQRLIVGSTNSGGYDDTRRVEEGTLCRSYFCEIELNTLSRRIVVDVETQSQLV